MVYEGHEWSWGLPGPGIVQQSDLHAITEMLRRGSDAGGGGTERKEKQIQIHSAPYCRPSEKEAEGWSEIRSKKLMMEIKLFF